MPWHVLTHSIISRSSVPVSISPVKLSQLPLTRPPEGSTEFSISRFLVPWLCNYHGLALFLDCDMLVRCDIEDIFRLYDGSDVQVVKHNYAPKADTKFYGNRQVAYPRKNWSSVMLMNTPFCLNLTLPYVNTASAMDLHRFAWTRSIGNLPITMNHLVGEYGYSPEAQIIHWTNGGPWLTRYSQADYASEWDFERMAMESYADD